MDRDEIREHYTEKYTLSIFHHSYRKIFEGSHGFLNIWTIRMIILKARGKAQNKRFSSSKNNNEEFRGLTKYK